MAGGHSLGIGILERPSASAVLAVEGFQRVGPWSCSGRGALIAGHGAGVRTLGDFGEVVRAELLEEAVQAGGGGGD